MGTLTVTGMLALPVFAGTEVAAGRRGLDRAVTGVNLMEVPDIERFTKAGEMLLTTAYPLRDRVDDLPDLISALHARGLAALAVKLGRYIDYLPPAALSRADELGFPVLVVADNLSFNDVITAAFTVLLAEEGTDADQSVIHERLTRVALAGGGLDDIARTLAIALGRAIRLRAAGLRYACSGDGNLQDWREGERWVGFQIEVAGVSRGVLEVADPESLSLRQRLLVRQASFAAALFVAQAQAAVELDERIRTLFLEDLVSGSGEIDLAILRERSRLFAWDLDGPRVVVMARLAQEVDGAAAARCSPNDDTGLPLVWSRGNEIVAIVASSRPLAWAASWQQALTRAFGTCRVAVGSTVAQPHELARSHAEARDALAIVERRGEVLASHQAVAVERMLLGLGRPALADLVASQLGPLEAADGHLDGPLLRTLETYLGHGNAAMAARELGVHYNTMKHRLGRIAVLLDCDLGHPPTRLALMLALAARRVYDLAVRPPAAPLAPGTAAKTRL